MTEPTDTTGIECLKLEIKRLRKWLENIEECSDEHEGEGHLASMARRALAGDAPNEL